jgi:hypothetical protein
VKSPAIDRAQEAAPAEPAVPTPPRAARSEPLADLNIQIRQPNQERVEIRLLQRSGELHVAVRATDLDLAHALRQDLPQLAGRIEQGGHRAEAWRPGGIVAPVEPAPAAGRPAAEHNAGDGQPQQRWSQPDRDQQNSHRHNVPKWVEDLEGALEGETGESYGLSN